MRNRQEKLPQLLVSSSLDESKNSPTTKSENSATNTGRGDEQEMLKLQDNTALIPVVSR